MTEDRPADRVGLALERRRELTRERVARHRARPAEGRRTVACDVEIAPGIRVRQVEIVDDVLAEETSGRPSITRRK
jgi:hypothetical protein